MAFFWPRVRIVTEIVDVSSTLDAYMLSVLISLSIYLLPTHAVCIIKLSLDSLKL